jgi:preprotein translocase subunit SecF
VSFVSIGRKSVMISGIVVVLCLVLLLWPGLNWGVDFTGGTILERRVGRGVSTGEIGAVMDGAVPEMNLSSSAIQLVDGDREFIVRTHELSNDEILRIDKAFEEAFGGLVELRTEVVGPVIGRELVRNAVLAVVVASIGILLYVAYRFEHRFAVVAVAALFHDVVLVLGCFVLLRREINSPFVASVLTVVGYSINNTIVIFDRMRENLKLSPKEPLPELVEGSIRQSLTRTINTSITTLLTVLMLVIFGGSAIRDFALALLIGVVVGTYSSVLVSGPLWLMWTERQRKPKMA